MPCHVQRLVQRGQMGKVHRGQTGQGEYAKIDAEIQHKQQCQPETWHGKAKEYKYSQRLIDPCSLPDSGNNTHGQSNDQRQRQGSDIHSHSERQPFHNLVDDRPRIAGQRDAEIKMKQPCKPVKILNKQGAIKSINSIQPCAHKLPCQGIEAGLHICGGTRGKMNHRKADKGNAPQNNEHPYCFAQQTNNKGGHLSCLTFHIYIAP